MVIHVPLDGSEMARSAVCAARALLSGLQGRIILFYAFWPGTPVDHANQAIEADVQALRELGVDTTLERRSTPRDEETGQVIATAAVDLGADLIVMTTHGRSGLGRWVF